MGNDSLEREQQCPSAKWKAAPVVESTFCCRPLERSGQVDTRRAGDLTLQGARAMSHEPTKMTSLPDICQAELEDIGKRNLVRTDRPAKEAVRTD